MSELGPWHYVPWHIVEGPSEVRHADGWLVCTTSSDDMARLIAAAPDLLAALKAVVAISMRKTDVWDAALAAITKADGRTLCTDTTRAQRFAPDGNRERNKGIEGHPDERDG